MQVTQHTMPLLIRACREIGGVSSTVTELPTTQQQVEFLQTPTIFKALQVYFQLIEIESLTPLEIEWLHSTEFLTPWYEHRTRLAELYLDLMETKSNQSSPLLTYMQEMIAVKFTESQQCRYIEMAHATGQPDLDTWNLETELVNAPRTLAFIAGSAKTGNLQTFADAITCLDSMATSRAQMLMIIQAVARTGHVHLVDWLIRNYCPGRILEMFQAAIQCDQLVILQYLLAHHRSQSPTPALMFHHAARSGSLKIVQTYGNWSEGTFPFTLDPNVTQWLLQNQTFDQSTLLYAWNDVLHRSIPGQNAKLLDTWYQHCPMIRSKLFWITCCGDRLAWRMLCRMIWKHSINVSKHSALLWMVDEIEPDIASEWIHWLLETGCCPDDALCDHIITCSGTVQHVQFLEQFCQLPWKPHHVDNLRNQIDLFEERSPTQTALIEHLEKRLGIVILE